MSEVGLIASIYKLSRLYKGVLLEMSHTSNIQYTGIKGL